ncbi:ABC transporter permease [Oceanibacterium hippocampi]|uniref:Spermidine/putrescine transport system permease protein PotB n=1 Tax=Oceanibacterium hippocampi TaxID=745714 RepID=A0A1Y5TY96_9PROT|nr:ABC transporter permease [Oceanibacterium hippocampi]SLN75688.1 Spermidine/putrescine transport system permease protein PotB [Oceanibacterium hippocampi]
MLAFIRRTWLLWPAIGLLLVFFLVPSLDLIQASVMNPDFTLEHFERIADRKVYLAVFWRTLQVSLIVAFLAALVGYPIAYFINLQPRKTQFLLIFLIFIPLWMSVLIRSYAWMIVLGRDGIINTALLGLGLTEEPVRLLFTSGAVYFAMLQILLPVQIVTAYSAMTEIDMDLMRAARVLGARPWQALRRVFIPLSLDGTITGAIIVFMLSMGFFITPALVGGRQDMMLANLIEFQVERLNWSFASALAILLLLGTVLTVIVIRRLGNLITRRIA